MNATALKRCCWLMRQRAIVSSSERLQETQLQGQAFCRATSDIWGGDLKDLTYPVAVGGIARRMEIDASLTSAIYLQASHYDLDIVLIESGGDNQSASFSPELADLTLYVSRRRNPAQGRPRDYKIGFAGYQQDRPCTACWRISGGDAARLP